MTLKLSSVDVATKLSGREPPSRTGIPDVSFVIAAFNVAAFIEEAIQSALAQAGVDVEIIVVDDMSSDGTAEVVERLSEAKSRVILIRQERNAGPGAARNAAFKRARGKWIAILDGDDYLTPDRTAILLARAHATGADIIGDNFERVSIDGRPTGQLLFAMARVPFLFTVDAPTFIDCNRLLGRQKFSLGAIKVMIRAEFLHKHAVMHLEDVPVGEDFQFILACLFRRARFVVSSTSGYKYRLRPGSQSWRLTNEHMEKLRLAHLTVLADAEKSGCVRAKSAAIAFDQSLVRVSDFVKAVTFAKEGSWGTALQWTALRPHTWSLVARHGGQAIYNKLRRLMLRPARG